MWEFIVNIWDGIVNNWEAIVTTLSSLNVAGVITNIALIAKQKKIITTNTGSTDAASAGLTTMTATNTKLVSTVQENTASNEILKKELKSDIDVIKTENVELKHQLSNVVNKLGHILEIMGLVYSTIRDEKIRTTVANIITNAKYSENETRAELEKQLEELKTKVVRDTELLKEEVTATVKQVENVISPVDTKRTNARY